MMVPLRFRPHLWTRLRDRRLRPIRTQFMPSLIMSTEYFLSMARRSGLLTTSGRRTTRTLSFSKARALPHLLSLSDIFIDIMGYLMGEAIVRKYIPTSPLCWSRIGHPPECKLEAVEDIKDWKALILKLWN